MELPLYKNSSKMSESNSDDDFQTPRRPVQPSANPGYSTQLARLEGVSRQFRRRARRLQEEPESAVTMARELVRSFSARRQSEGSISPVRRVRGRPTAEFRVRFTCLRSPATTNVCRLNLEELRRIGLGIPPHELRGQVARGWSRIQLDWDQTQLNDYIKTLFPVLISVPFNLASARRGGKLQQLPDEVKSAQALKDHLTGQSKTAICNPPVVYIVPTEDINHQPLGTPTVLARINQAPALDPTAAEVSQEQRQERNSTQNRNLSRTNTEAAIIEARRIRAEQDQAYEESLRRDQERARQQRVQEEQERERQRLEEAEEQNRLRTEREREARNDQIRSIRRSALPDQPNEGFMVRARLPGGVHVMRRFLPEMDIDSLICFIGAQESSTANFRIRIPGRTELTNSETSDITLSEMGLTTSTAVDVIWTEENPSQTEENEPLPEPVPGAPVPEEQMPAEGGSPEPQPAVIIQDRASSPEQDPARIIEPAIDAVPNPQLAEEPPQQGTNANAGQLTEQPVIEQPVIEQPVIEQPMVITVDRHSVVKDLLEAFKNIEHLHRRVKIIVRNENAEDVNGVFRDILTDFWDKLISVYFDGENQACPVINTDLNAADWEAIGSILYKGFDQVGYIPLRFSQASLVFGVLGREHLTEGILLDSFLFSLGSSEREVFQQCLELSSFSEEQGNDLLECLDRQGVRQLPTPANLRSLCVRCSEVASVERALFPLQSMNLRRLSSLPSLGTAEEIKTLYDRLRPTPRKVAEMIRVEASSPAEERVLGFLRRAIRSFSDEMLQKFLRFVGGSDTLNFSWISIQFVHLGGFSRRIVAHTCTHTLDLPVNYRTYNEFLIELKNQLNSDVWIMDIL